MMLFPLSNRYLKFLMERVGPVWQNTPGRTGGRGRCWIMILTLNYKGEEEGPELQPESQKPPPAAGEWGGKLEVRDSLRCASGWGLAELPVILAHSCNKDGRLAPSRASLQDLNRPVSTLSTKTDGGWRQNEILVVKQTAAEVTSLRNRVKQEKPVKRSWLYVRDGESTEWTEHLQFCQQTSPDEILCFVLFVQIEDE